MAHTSPTAFTFALQEPEYRCMDCIGGWFYCHDCIIADHSATPLHRIERWNGSYFEPAPPYAQLVLAGLIPATHSRPATAFTVQLLKHFQQMNLASKTAAHDYHKCLLQLSDAVQSHRIPSAYHQLVDVARQWRALEMLRSSGKLNAQNIARGDLAFTCPACPHPEVNIPKGWEDHPNRYGP
ncbi:hypothetical protein M407DRAFT_68026 [Tulasnella calospora MUT 4182]|uniref:CxC2-like cysteine cluster KDZ transposase-associated domain-containing protein n=1 Tax=Tulasnella calospora MUT 4182 TaxID=1051891 RepID=A0A0C3QRQ0_9AGAM|nr:hypothetical protein M407DRAFT_68026 [Tulasnella calospora MUT 4182]